MIPPTHDNAILNQDVRWGEFEIGDLFKIKGNPQLNKNKFVFSENGQYPYFTRTLDNNGILGYVDYLDDEHKINGNSIAVGMLGMKFFYMKHDFYAGQFTKTVFATFEQLNREIALYFTTIFNKNSGLYQSELIRKLEELFTKTKIQLPVIENGLPNFEYMESYINHIENEYIVNLEKERNIILNAYLKAASLTFYELDSEDKEILAFEPQWGEFRIGDLFDTIKRGKRIKSIDRISGNLPFITAGAIERGFSSYIGNPEAEIFPKNSLTIDMFGTVFYRGYEYGADDHVAVLYNKAAKYSKEALIYMGVCIEKSISGKFSYSRNFYASDAYDAVVMLPETKNETPDFVYMESYINAHKKLAIENKIRGFDLKINAAKFIIQKRV